MELQDLECSREIEKDSVKLPIIEHGAKQGYDIVTLCSGVVEPGHCGSIISGHKEMLNASSRRDVDKRRKGAKAPKEALVKCRRLYRGEDQQRERQGSAAGSRPGRLSSRHATHTGAPGAASVPGTDASLERQFDTNSPLHPTYLGAMPETGRQRSEEKLAKIKILEMRTASGSVREREVDALLNTL